MNQYLICIGGTGAKFLEAFVHLAAAGLCGKQRCRMFFVDPDASNGSLMRSLSSLQKYLNCSWFKSDEVDAFSATLNPFKERVWSPLPDHDKRSLAAFYHYRDPNEKHRAAARFMDVLFSPGQIDLPLDEGFRGNPAIGAAVMASTVNLNQVEPWAELYEDLRDDSANRGGASVLLAGSLFGGTGAAGIPTIARLIRNHLQSAGIENVHVGAILMLPYFSFGDVRGEKDQANAKEFLPATQAALQYYHERRYLDLIDAAYLLGEHALSTVEPPSVGGRTQTNDPHVLELYAALAAIDFFQNPADARGSMLTARHSAGAIDWRDLPGPLAVDLRIALGQFLRFAYGYLSACYPPLIQYIRTRASYRTPWLGNFLPKGNDVDLQVLAKQAEQLKLFCEAFLVWFGSLHFSARDADLSLQLASAERFTERAGDPPEIRVHAALDPSFDNLLLPHRPKEGLSMKDVYEELADARPAMANAQHGFSELARHLYQLCGKKLN